MTSPTNHAWEALADRLDRGAPGSGWDGVRRVEAPAVDPAFEPVREYGRDVPRNLGVARIEFDERVVALEDVDAEAVDLVRAVAAREARRLHGPLARRDGRPPPRVLASDMVEHSVEEHADPAFAAGGDQRVEVALVAETRVDRQVVDRVVAVRARGEDRAELEPVAAQGEEVVEPGQQGTEAVPRLVARPRSLRRGGLGAREAERIHVPPDRRRDPAVPLRHRRRLSGALWRVPPPL